MAKKPLSEALVDHEPLATPTLYHLQHSSYTWYYHMMPMKGRISQLYAGKRIAHELVNFECWWQIPNTIRQPIWMLYYVHPRHRGSPDRRIYYGKMQGHWLRRLHPLSVLESGECTSVHLILVHHGCDCNTKHATNNTFILRVGHGSVGRAYINNIWKARCRGGWLKWHSWK